MSTNLQQIAMSADAMADFLIRYEQEPTLVCRKEVWDPEREPECTAPTGGCIGCLKRWLNAESD